jgi:uncharacterized membrane protein YphA (DoxX/SURF4 family)
MTTHALTPSTGKFLGPALWAVQVLLALFFIYAGYTKLATPAAALAQAMPWTAQHPGLVPWTGLVDLLGGIGILLPALTRVLPGLTPLAAAGLVALQVVALAFHITRGELAVAPLNLVLMALAGWVWWGRSRALPIAPRA